MILAGWFQTVRSCEMDAGRSEGENMKAENVSDTEPVFTFLTAFSRFEQALKKAGFTLPGQNAQPDWERFAKDVEGRFDLEATPELQGAVLYVLRSSKRQPRGTISGYLSEVLWLATLIQETAKNLSRRMNFGHLPDIDDEFMTASRVILEAWSHCNPNLEKILNGVQYL
jgi:hypothetical protein